MKISPYKSPTQSADKRIENLAFELGCSLISPLDLSEGDRIVWNDGRISDVVHILSENQKGFLAECFGIENIPIYVKIPKIGLVMIMKKQ